MRTVSQLLKTKGNAMWSVRPDTSVFDALQLMSDKDVGALLVLENGTLVGIFSERDYARKLVLKGKISRKTEVGELMTKDVICTDSTKSFEDCMAMMTDKRIRHLPVVDNEQLVGIVTMGDVVKQIIHEQEHTIHDLENYISGGY